MGSSKSNGEKTQPHLPFLTMVVSPSSPGMAGQIGQVQFSSVAQLCLTLGDPMGCSTPGFPVYHPLLEFNQTHVHRPSSIELVMQMLLS